MQTEKILVPIFVGALGLLITAILALVKLINDKEGKTSEYRQAWTDSVRKSLADSISNVNLLANGINLRLDLLDKKEVNANPEKLAKTKSGIFKKFQSALNRDNNEASDEQQKTQKEKQNLEYEKNRLESEDEYIRVQWKNLHQSFALARLHFKTDDEKFQLLESEFKAILEKLNKLEKMGGSTNRVDRNNCFFEIKVAVEAITQKSRELLKKEWEIIKKGEKAFKITKIFAFFFIPIAFIAMVYLGFTIGNSPAKDSSVIFGFFSRSAMTAKDLKSDQNSVVDSSSPSGMVNQQIVTINSGTHQRVVKTTPSSKPKCVPINTDTNNMPRTCAAPSTQ